MNVQNETTRVLIAHIIDDKKVAEKLKENLITYASDRLECLLWCEENRPNSLENLQEKIHGTDLLILFVASSIVDAEDWGWLQGATAMSRYMNNGHVARILLHNRTLTPPKFLKVTVEHCYRSEPDDLKEFIKYFFGSGNFTQNRQPLNRNFINNNTPQLNNLVETIHSFFPETLALIHQYTFPKTIALIAEDPDRLTRENLLTEIRMKSEKADSLDIFGLFDDLSLGNTNRSWEDIVNNLPRDNSQRWSEELADSVYLAHHGRSPRVVQSTFRSSDGRLYRPILYRRESLSNGSKRFIVLFVEHISEGWVDNPPDPRLATLLTASILGARLQWGVCNRYLKQLTRQQGDTDAIRKNLLQVKVSFENIEKDATTRREGEAPGQSNEDRLRESFDSEDERRTIADNLSEQEQHKQILLRADTQDNVDKVRVALTELKRLNEIVMRMVAKQYSQLLNRNSP